jgi:hypothetical protein
MRPTPARGFTGTLLAFAVGSCSVFSGGGGKPETTAARKASAEQVDVSRYLGPDYCPELRIPEGTEVMRRYERGHEDDPGFVVWQASIGETARECRFDGQGNLAIKVGVSGRLISGPKGGQATVSIPLRIGVVKYQEAVLASQIFPLEVAIPPNGSTVFTQVPEVVVPSPGTDRDYILYVALSEQEVDWLNPVSESALAAVDEPVTVIEEPSPEPAAAPPQPQQQAPQSKPNELPVPSGGGFVLPGS